ncbi:uncharacterized protein LOC111693741 [Trichogramma pretiosum]|uniref:uncharacterized protein LOC111693741 n=1 Tax=Trichogramma pretiosum TaxID=7493 RepID=UPI000C7189C1|nr:uncharacterized protein LOC111693741 [Trichogramma pretiosum]XP_023315062.1 uncharacterized protein LOC111693741 [Trichogramma pretiosum]
MGYTKKSKKNQKKDVKKKVVKKNTATNSTKKKVTKKTGSKAAAVKKNLKVPRKLYSSTALEKAVKAVNEQNKLSLREVAQAYGIPVTTLFRKKSNPDALHTKPGPDIVLSNETEKNIADWVVYRNQTGFSVNRDQLLDAVASCVKIMKLKTPFINDRPGRHWFEKFLKRYSDLSIKRTPRSDRKNKAKVTKDDVEGWFCAIQKYLNSKKLVNISADRVFNCKEASVSVDPKIENVVTTKRDCTEGNVGDADETRFNILCMYSGMGIRAPPMIMYNKEVSESVVKNLPERWGTGLSENGWMTAESFYKYICDIFYPWLVKEKVQFPVIIYADNHLSYFSIPLVSFCREKNIEILGLIPSSTHIIQPLDISFFESFEESWKNIVLQRKKVNKVSELKEVHYGRVVNYALENMPNEIESVVNGFEASGLAPFNPLAVNYIFAKRVKTSQQTPQNQIQNVHEEESVVNNEQTNSEMLRHLEASLAPDVLEKFEFSKDIGLWAGDIEFKAMFEYWLRLKSPSTSQFYSQH